MVNKDPMMDKISQIQATYADYLMQKKHVIGLGIGKKKKAGENTDSLALVVLVDEKVPEDELAQEDIIPAKIEGIPTDVQATGNLLAF